MGGAELETILFVGNKTDVPIVQKILIKTCCLVGVWGGGRMKLYKAETV
jgi:hypothetical protein